MGKCANFQKSKPRTNLYFNRKVHLISIGLWGTGHFISPMTSGVVNPVSFFPFGTRPKEQLDNA